MKVGVDVADAELQLPAEAQTLEPAGFHLVVDPGLLHLKQRHEVVHVSNARWWPDAVAALLRPPLGTAASAAGYARAEIGVTDIHHLLAVVTVVHGAGAGCPESCPTQGGSGATAYSSPSVRLPRWISVAVTQAIAPRVALLRHAFADSPASSPKVSPNEQRPALALLLELAARSVLRNLGADEEFWRARQERLRPRAVAASRAIAAVGALSLLTASLEDRPTLAGLVSMPTVLALILAVSDLTGGWRPY